MYPVRPLSPNLITLRSFLSTLPQMKLCIPFISMHATCSTHFTICDFIFHILPEKPALNILFFLILATASQSCFGFSRLDGIICLSFFRALTNCTSLHFSRVWQSLRYIMRKMFVWVLNRECNGRLYIFRSFFPPRTNNFCFYPCPLSLFDTDMHIVTDVPTDYGLCDTYA